MSGDKSIDSRPSPDRDGGEETETAPEAEDEVWFILYFNKLSRCQISL